MIRASLTRESAESLVHAFISSRLDYGNAVLSGIGSSLMERLQLVQNAAARLVSGTRKFDHITPVPERDALVACETANHIQSCHAGVQMPHFSCTWLSHDRLCAGRIYHWEKALALCKVPDACCATIEDRNRQQTFCSRRSNSLEQPTSAAESNGLLISNIQALSQNTFVYQEFRPLNQFAAEII